MPMKPTKDKKPATLLIRRTTLAMLDEYCAANPEIHKSRFVDDAIVAALLGVPKPSPAKAPLRKPKPDAKA